MDSKDLKGLMEAYQQIHAPEQLDEISANLALTASQKADEERRKAAISGDKARAAKKVAQASRLYKGVGPRRAKERAAANEEVQNVDEATAMAKRGYDEAPIRQKIAKSTGGGKAADRATALEKKPTYGNDKAAKQRSELARKQRTDFRKTTSSSPGLHGYGHKSNDPAVKAKQAARGAQRGALTPNEKKELNREEFQLDQMIESLVERGHTEQEAFALVTKFTLDESQHARENPEKYEREQSKKYAPVRGEKTPMPPRGDKRREEFEKWYAKQMGR